MRIDGHTKLTGIIGYPVRHSLSPLMHNSAFESLGLNYCYVPMEVPPELLKDAISGLRALGFVGVNVTVPHKERVLEYLDELSEEARFIGAVNTIHIKDGKLKGYNTDAGGFIRSLKEEGILPEAREVFLAGAGGASKAVAFGLCGVCSKLYIYNRTTEKAETLAEKLRQRGCTVEVLKSPEVPEGVSLVINATSLGLKEDDPLPMDVNTLIKGQVVYDLIYKETPLLKEASRRGLRAIDGSGMLLWQAVAAFRIWTGQEPPVEVMRAALRKR
ncbi:MAG: shikimate dehydrogenase [Nitrospirae bacterium]|nr:MAG: shikimate dehydrogenase [Nitrospirota bacterium]